MTQISPYTPGEVARSVPGRSRELQELQDSLDLLRIRQLVPRIRVDHAPRGYGKTSLLREYERRARGMRALTVWVTAGEGPLVPQLAAQLRRHAPGSIRRAIAQHLEVLEVQAGIAPIGQVRARIRPAAGPDATSPARALQEVITAVADGVPHHGLVILVDEIQEADPAGLRTLAYAWQQLQSDAPDIPAAVFTAGLPNAPEVISSAVTFAERFRFRAIGPLPPTAEELAIIEPAADLGVTWARDALDRAVEISDGYPYFVQLIADHSWNAAGNPDPSATITRDDVDRGEQLMRDDLDALYRARWAQASAGEQNLMRAMAIYGDAPAPRGELAAAIGVASSALSVPRQRLIDKGMIATAGYGALRFTLPGFAAYITFRES